MSWVAGVVLALATAPLSAQRTDTTTAAPLPPPPPPPPKSSSRQITEEDIERLGSSAANAYDVVQALRPQWLRQRNEIMSRPGSGPAATSQFSVFVNDHEMGGLNFLRALPAEQVYSMRFLTMNEVGARYGPTSGPGIIVVLRH